jgi:hypothetical protein
MESGSGPTAAHSLVPRSLVQAMTSVRSPQRSEAVDFQNVDFPLSPAKAMLFAHLISKAFQRRIISLLLLVMAWNGPVPILHNHDTCSNNFVLHRHIEKFHSGVTDVALAGAHWHFAFVDDLMGDLLPGSVCQYLPAPAVLGESEATGLRWCHAWSDHRCSTEWHACRADTQATASLTCGLTPESFLSTLLDDAPMIAVTGVCQI